MGDAVRWTVAFTLVGLASGVVPAAAAVQAHIELTAQVGWGDSVELQWNVTELPGSRFQMYQISRAETPYLVYPPASSYRLLYNESERNATRFVDRTVTPRNSYFYRIEVMDRNGQYEDGTTVHVTTWPLGTYPSAWMFGSSITSLGLTFILGWVVPLLFPGSNRARYLGDQIFRMLVLTFVLLLVGLIMFGLGL